MSRMRVSAGGILAIENVGCWFGRMMNMWGPSLIGAWIAGVGETAAFRMF